MIPQSALVAGWINRWAVLTGFVVLAAIAVEVRRERAARRRAREAEVRLGLFSQTGNVLSQSFDFEKTLSGVVQLAAASFQGLCLIHLPAAGSQPERLVTAHPDAALDARIRRLSPPFTPGLGAGMASPGPGPERGTIVHSSDAFLRTIAGSDGNLALLRDLDAPDWMLVPMVANEQFLGTFAVAGSRSPILHDRDLEVAQELADRTALAVAGALLVADKERALEEAVAAAGRTARLEALTATLGSSLSPADAGAIIAGESIAALGADRAVVYEFLPAEGLMKVVAATGYSDAQLAGFTEIAVDEDHTLPKGVATRNVVLGAGHSDAPPMVFEGDGFPPERAALIAPLLLKGRLAGHLYLAFDAPPVLGMEDMRMLEALAGLCAQVLERVRMVQREQSARAAAEQSALRLSLVSRASALLAVELDYPRAYSRLAELLVEDICDICLIDVTDGETIRRVAAAHADPARRPLMDILRERYAPTRTGKHPVSRVLQSGQPEMAPHMPEALLREISRDEEHFRIIRDLGFRSFMCVPLAARGRILGTLTLVSTDPIRRYGDADLAMAQEVARRAAVRIDNARLYAAEQDARRAAEAAAALSAALSDAVSLDDVLDVVSEGMRDALGAATSTVGLLDPSGVELEMVRRVGPRSSGSEAWRRFRVDADLPMSEAVRSNAPVIVASNEERKHRYPLLAGIDALFDHSLICLPLEVEGRAIGGIALGYPDVRTVSRDDTRLAMTLAGQAAQAMARARLYEAELASRREAEVARERLSFLADASRVLSSSLDWNLTLSRVAHLAVPRIADWCAVDALDESGHIRRLVVAHADPQKAAAARRMELMYPPDPEAATGVARVIRSGVSELLPDVGEETLRKIEHEELRAVIGELGMRSVMIVALPSRGSIAGTISFVSAGSDRRFGPADLELAEDLARRAGVAVDNARLYQERDHIAQALQRSLLPQRLPTVPGLEFEGRYHALGAGNEVGGDFYDVFDSGDGTWGMTIGDVCGKGPEAAAVMGVVRYTLRAAAMHEARPSLLLTSLNEALRQHVSDERFCTVCYVRVRPGDQGARLTVCLAGHPAPLVVRANQTVERVGRAGTILGVLPDLSLTDVTVDLGPGDAIVMFTDGLTDERRGEEAGGEHGLVRALQEARGATAADLADLLDQRITDPSFRPPRDDAAILVARVTP